MTLRNRSKKLRYVKFYDALENGGAISKTHHFNIDGFDAVYFRS